MGASQPLNKHIDALMAHVEKLQQSVAQLYVELQAIHNHLNAESHPEAAELPMAMPVVPEPESFHALRPIDRRTSPRRQVNQVLIAISSALDDSRPFTGWVLDYSANGLGLFVEKKMVVGTYLRIRPSQSPEGTQGHEATVRNCQPYLDGWRLGCQLDKAFTADDLMLFGLE